jgi:hypothetical protein
MVCSWTTHVHAGLTSLKVSAHPKRKDGNAIEDSMYLLGPNGSSFHPLKIPESTISVKGCFFTFGRFSIYNGDYELPTFYL